MLCIPCRWAEVLLGRGVWWTLTPLCVCLCSGRGDQEALPHPEQPVQALPGDAHADPQPVPALLRPLHQTQRAEEAHGESRRVEVVR